MLELLDRKCVILLGVGEVFVFEFKFGCDIVYFWGICWWGFINFDVMGGEWAFLNWGEVSLGKYMAFDWVDKWCL